MTGIARSQRLLAYEFTAAGFSPAFTSPAGYVTLVKSAYFSGGGAGPTKVQLSIIVPEISGAPAFFIGESSDSTIVTWQGWIVLNPGDAVVAYAAAGVTIVVISGAILAGPNQFPPGTRQLPTLEPHR